MLSAGLTCKLILRGNGRDGKVVMNVQVDNLQMDRNSIHAETATTNLTPQSGGKVDNLLTISTTTGTDSPLLIAPNGDGKVVMGSPLKVNSLKVDAVCVEAIILGSADPLKTGSLTLDGDTLSMSPLALNTADVPP